MVWNKVVTPVENTDLNQIDYLISIDESGTPTITNLTASTPMHQRWFTLSCSIIKVSDINSTAKTIVQLKNKYWEDGKFNNNRVCFHSRNIRRCEGPFSNRVIDNKKFREDLIKTISEIPFSICASTVDKFEHITKYLYPDPVYSMSLKFCLERISRFLNKQHATAILLLERRGWNEDNITLKKIYSLLTTGNEYLDAPTFDCIKGVYFSQKWNKCKDKSYWPLEISDIVSYRINKYVFADSLNSFEPISKKLIGYPSFKGVGLKIFP